jgi:hypothetical protein
MDFRDVKHTNDFSVAEKLTKEDIHKEYPRSDGWEIMTYGVQIADQNCPPS